MSPRKSVLNKRGEGSTRAHGVQGVPSERAEAVQVQRRSSFDGAAKDHQGKSWGFAPKRFDAASMPTGRLAKIAKDNLMPLDFIKQAYEIFVDLAKPSSQSLIVREEDYDVLTDGELDTEAFAKVLCKLSNLESPEQLPDGLLFSAFNSADANESAKLDFLEFSVWYARHGFSESVLLTPEQREIRQIARKHGLKVVDVEEYKKAFTHFDEDGSGEIELQEFRALLYALIKIPGGLDLPESRIRAFWTEACCEDSQAINFEEFLLFYMRYFGPGKTERGGGGSGRTRSALEEFYRALRPVPIPRAW